jgi:hypothetical protein
LSQPASLHPEIMLRRHARSRFRLPVEQHRREPGQQRERQTT